MVTKRWFPKPSARLWNIPLSSMVEYPKLMLVCKGDRGVELHKDCRLLEVGSCPIELAKSVEMYSWFCQAGGGVGQPSMEYLMPG